ncbi:hypothetical protein [Ruegeria sp. ANG-R]|uniref:hypothetical protein n=1 Tax=Ruegeria sp. ANG-R TaxID=1577903 RepID=UPI000A9995BF|nr:hypothetical protein [Ruegeria sp. ANG-R]
MQYKPPKGILSHPGVEACDSGEAGGSDYKHDVLLKVGWAFTNGRMAGCRTGLFHTVSDFKHAESVEGK